MPTRFVEPPQSAATPDVIVGWLHPGEVKAKFLESMLNLQTWDAAHDRRIRGFVNIQSSANISKGRNTLAQMLLDSDAEWLLTLDSDMSFEPDLLDRLLKSADPNERPIIGGLCFGYAADGTIKPTLYGLDKDDAGDFVVLQYNLWPSDELFKVAATGAACMLVHRSVFQAMLDIEPKGRNGAKGFNDAFPWFQESTVNGHDIVGEDFTFCWRAGMCGFPVYVETSVRLGHVKQKELTVDVYLDQFTTTEEKEDSE